MFRVKWAFRIIFLDRCYILAPGDSRPKYAKLKQRIDELQGVSAFYRDKDGDIYHTYSSYARGIDLMNTTYNFLDLTAKGRDENPDASQDWVRYHDQYKGASKDCGA